jgi:hypothetical protein
LLLRQYRDHRHNPSYLPRQGHDVLSLCKQHPHFGLFEVRRSTGYKVREIAAKLAEAAGVSIEHVSKSYLRKEEIVAKAIARRGDHPGLAHVIFHGSVRRLQALTG